MSEGLTEPIPAGKDVEKVETLHTADGNAKCCSGCGERYGGFSNGET